MSEESFGRQPLPVTVTIEGALEDVIYWAQQLKNKAEFKGDIADYIEKQKDHIKFKIYPRAVND